MMFAKCGKKIKICGGKSMLMNLQQAIENPLACEERQLKNWLSTLNEYYKRDTDMQVKQMCLAGNSICPA